MNADGSKRPDIFVHFSGIKSNGWKTLNDGDQVEFDIIAGPKGPQANDTVVLVPGRPDVSKVLTPAATEEG